MLRRSWRRRVLEPDAVVAGLCQLLATARDVLEAAAGASGDPRWAVTVARLDAAIDALRGHPPRPGGPGP